MTTINRGMLVVRAREPFIAWLRTLPDPVPDAELAHAFQERTAYLVPEWDDNAKLEKVLKRYATKIFEEELEGWWRVKADWPKDRTLSKIREWFDIECCSLVMNLATAPVLEEGP